MEQQTNLIEEVYCPRCFLATPLWRSLCIHCRAPLPAEPSEIRKRANAA